MSLEVSRVPYLCPLIFQYEDLQGTLLLLALSAVPTCSLLLAAPVIVDPKCFCCDLPLSGRRLISCCPQFDISVGSRVSRKGMPMPHPAFTLDRQSVPKDQKKEWPDPRRPSYRRIICHPAPNASRRNSCASILQDNGDSRDGEGGTSTMNRGRKVGEVGVSAG